MVSTFKWTFEGEIPPGVSGDQLLEIASLIVREHPEFKMKITEFDNNPSRGVINLPTRAGLGWMNGLDWK